MPNNAHLNPELRHDFVVVFDVKDGNPNGDPDADNQPRVDTATGLGKVTDVCIKRKIRDYVALVDGEGRNKIYVEAAEALNSKHGRAWEVVSPATNPKDREHKNTPQETRDQLRTWMCNEFFDVRTFGAVMGTSVSGGGQVRGPVQLTFATSVDPVDVTQNALTRVVRTKEDDKKDTEMGDKWTIPYGVYVGYGFYSAPLAARTGIDAADLGMLWSALTNMFEHDRSAARGLMSTRGLYVFTHDSRLGNAPAHSLFDLVKVRANGDTPARNFSDYTVSVGDVPEGVSLERLVG